MSFFHLQTLASVRQTAINEPQAVDTLNPLERAFLAKLRSDKWPWIGVRCITLTLADGSLYTPTLVSVIEGAVTCWEVADEKQPLGTAWPARLARVLPWVESPAVYFCTAHRLGRGWVLRDVVPTSDIPEELLAARETFTRMQTRVGRPATDWDFRDWTCGLITAMEKRSLGMMKRYGPRPAAPEHTRLKSA